jgi:pSer/pThr/pTyr-binding forkhead associated (FHA) protein
MGGSVAHENDQSGNEEDVWGAVSRTEPGAPFALKVFKGNELVRIVRLEPDVTYIGRMGENHIVLDDPKVSRSHARVMNRNGEFFIEDQESENGIFVGGKKVLVHPLAEGGRISIGGHVLEVVLATDDDRTARRESQLEQAEEEEWRMDQTVSGSPELLKRMLAARAAKAAAPKTRKAPTLTFDLKFGGKSFQNTLEFTQARARKEEDLTGDIVEVRVSIGKWVLYKKVPL